MSEPRIHRLLESIDSKLTEHNSLLYEVRDRVTRLEALQESDAITRKRISKEVEDLRTRYMVLQQQVSSVEGEIPEELSEQLVTLREDVASVKVKTGIWGAIFGFCTAAAAALWAWFKGS